MNEFEIKDKLKTDVDHAKNFNKEFGVYVEKEEQNHYGK